MNEVITKIRNIIRKRTLGFSSWLKKLSIVELLIGLFIILAILIVINNILIARNLNNTESLQEEQLARVNVYTDGEFREEVSTDYPNLFEALPYVGDGCRIVMDRDENGDEYLAVILYGEDATAENCGANIFIKRNLSKLDGIKIEERRSSYEGDF